MNKMSTKYYVDVNEWCLVTVWADSALQAEHTCLDLNGIRSANAYGPDDRGTEYFRTVMVNRTTIGFMELVDFTIRYSQIMEMIADHKDEIRFEENDQEDLKEALFQKDPSDHQEITRILTDLKLSMEHVKDLQDEINSLDQERRKITERLYIREVDND